MAHVLLPQILRFDPTDRVPHERCDVLQFQLLLYVSAVDVDCLGAQMELLGYVAGALSLAHEPEDLELAVAQLLDRGA